MTVSPAATPEFGDAVVLNAIPGIWVVVNVAEVPFMSSIGIRTIIVAGRAQKQRGGKFVLAAPQPMVRKVLVTAGIDQLGPLYDTVDAACEALRKD